MKVSKAIKTLQEIKKRFGEVSIIGGHLQDDVPMRKIVVTDRKGLEVWPGDPNGVAGQNPIDGVFLE